MEEELRTMTRGMLLGAVVAMALACLGMLLGCSQEPPDGVEGLYETGMEAHRGDEPQIVPACLSGLEGAHACDDTTPAGLQCWAYANLPCHVCARLACEGNPHVCNLDVGCE